jgi:8-oxo-dGTP pyrophosphatase MutT (NUDIX family)
VGFPDHPTIAVPGRWPELAALVRSIPIDPFGTRDDLAAALERGDGGREGHVCATAWVLDHDATSVLLLEHAILGWATPGGHVESGEDPGATASRELREETGLDLTPEPPAPQVLHPAWFPDSAKGPGHWHHNIGYRFAADRAAPLQGEPGVSVAWFPVDGLPEPRVPDLEAVLAALRRLRAT